MSRKQLVLVDPFPRRIDEIFSPAAWQSLEDSAEVVVHDDGATTMPLHILDSHIGDAVVIIGQPDLPQERLARATKLRGIINVETNFFPNVDYDYCAEHGIHVLTPGSAFASVVAETALGMAIDLARDISISDRAFRTGTETYGLESNEKSFSLFNTSVGFVGFGDLGRALLRLLRPFGCVFRAYDPWLPDYYLEKAGVQPESLEGVLSKSRVVFVLASVSAENQGFLDKSKLGLVQDGSVFLLMSRAAVVDWDDFLAESSRLKLGTDVFPQEPIAERDSVRETPMLLSAHRAGAMRSALLDIGEQTLADAKQLLQRLPPVVCRKATRETVGKLRSKPVSKT